jgi:hypothetical protein
MNLFVERPARYDKYDNLRTYERALLEDSLQGQYIVISDARVVGVYKQKFEALIDAGNREGPAIVKYVGLREPPEEVDELVDAS